MQRQGRNCAHRYGTSRHGCRWGSCTGTHSLTRRYAVPRVYQKGNVTSLQQAWSADGHTCLAQETIQASCWTAKVMSNHLLSLFDLGQASVEDGALVCEIDAIELLRNLLSDQFLRPAVWAINDDQPGNRNASKLQKFMQFPRMLQCAYGCEYTISACTSWVCWCCDKHTLDCRLLFGYTRMSPAR